MSTEQSKFEKKYKKTKKMNWAIVDVQGFKDNNNRFIVKEFYLETKNLIFHDIIKSPNGLKRKLNRKRKNDIKWLIHTALSWNRLECWFYYNKRIAQHAFPLLE